MTYYKKGNDVNSLRRYLLNLYSISPREKDEYYLSNVNSVFSWAKVSDIRAANMWLKRNGYAIFQKIRLNGKIMGTDRVVIKAVDF